MPELEYRIRLNDVEVEVIKTALEKMPDPTVQPMENISVLVSLILRLTALKKGTYSKRQNSLSRKVLKKIREMKQPV